MRTRMLGSPRGQDRAAHRINLSAAAGDFVHPTKSCRGIKYRRSTGDAPGRGCSSFDFTSRNTKDLTLTARGPRGSRCASLALRWLLARGFCCARLPPFQLGHPLLDAAHPLDGLYSGYQIHDLRRLVGRQDTRGAGGEDRARSLDQVAGARDLGQLEDDRAIAQRRQQPPDAKPQRHPVACQGRLDELARERLGRAVKHGLERESGLVAGPLRPSPAPAA
jgi:hypothetical protein